MLSVPRAQVVRGYSFFGDSYVYVIFADGTDMYWARSRVLEYLNQAASGLPVGVRPRLVSVGSLPFALRIWSPKLQLWKCLILIQNKSKLKL